MKHLFKIASLILASALLFVACEKAPAGTEGNDPTPDSTQPQFPTAVTQTVEPGSEFTLNIEPNMAWEVKVPEATAAYFQIKDGDNLVYTKRGDAGSHTIIIAVSNVEEFDTDHICEVTMTMQGKSQTIATLTLARKQRELKLYAVVVEDGTFSYATEGEQTYAYQSTEVAAEGMKMIWPEEMGLYSTRVKVESNFNWVVDGTPEWIVPIEGGEAGVTELWIKGDEAKYPMTEQSAVLSFVDATATDKSIASIKITIPAATEIFSVDGLTSKTEFNYKGYIYNSMVGEYVEGSAIASILGIDGSAVLAVEFTEVAGLAQATLNPEWLTIDYAEWDTTNSAVIQLRALNLSVPQNEGHLRRATVLALPQDVASLTNDIDKITLNGQIAEEYQQYVVTVVEQAGNPGSIEIVGEQAMEEKGNSLEQLEGSHWVFGLFEGAEVGYNVLYTSEWAYENWYVNVIRPYTAIKCYSFDANGALVELTDSQTAWISTSISGENNENVRIIMDKTKETAAAAKNENTGEYEGVVAFEDENGVFALILCRYNDEIPYVFEGIEFCYPTYAAEQKSTLVELTSGTLYNAYSRYGDRVFQLTYTTATPNMSMLKGLPQQFSYVNENDKEWLSYEYSEEYQMVIMDSVKGNNRNGALVFADGAVVLICTLKIAK